MDFFKLIHIHCKVNSLSLQLITNCRLTSMTHRFIYGLKALNFALGVKLSEADILSYWQWCKYQVDINATHWNLN